MNEKLYVMLGDAIAMLFVTLVAGMEVVLFAIARWLLRPLQSGPEIPARPVGPTAQNTAPLRPAGRKLLQPLLALLQQKWQQFRQQHPMSGVPMARDMRIALFLFVLSEELLRSFLPLHVKELVTATSRLGMELSIGAPLLAFLFFSGAGTLFCSGWIMRIGLRRAFATGAMLACLSLIGLALARSLPEMIALRILSALGYAISTIACQIYIVQVTTAETRSRDMAISVSAITAACVCGAPIGALLADMMGKPVVFLFAALMALLSWLAFRNAVMPESQNDAAPGAELAPTPDADGYLAMLRDWRFASLIACAVVPGKFLLAGMLFYITPLLLQHYGLAQASIGQFFLLFYALLFGANYLLSRLADKPLSQMRRIATGSLMSGLGIMPLFWFDSPIALAVGIICFGIGQGLASTAHNIMALNLVRESLPQVPTSKAIALLRSFERVGGILGAATAVMLSVVLDYRIAAAVLGCMVLFMGLGTLPLLFSLSSRRKSG